VLNDAARGGGGGMLRLETQRDPRQPRVGFLPHRPAQLAQRHVADRLAREEIDAARRIWHVTFVLGFVGSEHLIAMRVVDHQ